MLISRLFKHLTAYFTCFFPSASKFFAVLPALLSLLPMMAGAAEVPLNDYFISLRNGNAAEVKEWLNKGADVNALDERGETPLMMAVRFDDNVEAVKLLLRARAKSYLRNPYGETALMLAVYNGFTKSVAALLAGGTDISETNRQGWTPLIYAAYSGHTDIAALLLAHGAPADSASGNGLTALMLAARNGHLDTVRLLLAKGADRARKNEAGLTAREMALKAGNTDIAKLLAL